MAASQELIDRIEYYEKRILWLQSLVERLIGVEEPIRKKLKKTCPFRVIDGGKKLEEQPPFATNT